MSDCGCHHEAKNAHERRVLWIALAGLWLLLFVLMGLEPLHAWRGLLQRLAEWSVYSVLSDAAEKGAQFVAPCAISKAEISVSALIFASRNASIIPSLVGFFI